MSLLGLVRHMADVEQNWFRRCWTNGEVPGIFWSADNEDGDFDDVDTAVVADDFATWRAQCEHARELAASKQLDDAGVRHGKPVTLRLIYVHMIEEYARHNGHADFLRERIDGATGD